MNNGESARKPTSKVSRADSPAEQEADRMMHSAMQTLTADGVAQDGPKLDASVNSSSESTLYRQAKESPQVGFAGGPVPDSVETELTSAKGGGQPLNRSTRQQMEKAFGADFGDVRVHTDTRASWLNQSLQSQAFTSKQDIFFGPGQFQPSQRSGQELLAHELSHVVQQRSAPSGTPQIHRRWINANDKNYPNKVRWDDQIAGVSWSYEDGKYYFEVEGSPNTFEQEYGEALFNFIDKRGYKGLTLEQITAEALAAKAKIMLPPAVGADNDQQQNDDNNNNQNADNEEEEEYHHGLSNEELNSEWDTSTLAKVLKQDKKSGICNAMTTAYLSGAMDPSKGKLGINQNIYNKLSTLKDTLDGAQALALQKNDGLESKDMTHQTLKILKSNGIQGKDYLNSMDSNKVKKQSKALYSNIKKNDTPAVKILDEMSLDKIKEGFLTEKICDAQKELHTKDLNGYIALDASIKDDHKSAGHQFAFNYDGSVLTIFDQSTGLATTVTKNPAQALAKHLIETYVEDPIVLEDGDETNQLSFDIVLY